MDELAGCQTREVFDPKLDEELFEDVEEEEEPTEAADEGVSDDADASAVAISSTKKPIVIKRTGLVKSAVKPVAVAKPSETANHTRPVRPLPSGTTKSKHIKDEIREGGQRCQACGGLSLTVQMIIERRSLPVSHLASTPMCRLTSEAAKPRGPSRAPLTRDDIPARLKQVVEPAAVERKPSLEQETLFLPSSPPNPFIDDEAVESEDDGEVSSDDDDEDDSIEEVFEKSRRTKRGSKSGGRSVRNWDGTTNDDIEPEAENLVASSMRSSSSDDFDGIESVEGLLGDDQDASSLAASDDNAPVQLGSQDGARGSAETEQYPLPDDLATQHNHHAQDSYSDRQSSRSSSPMSPPIQSDSIPVALIDSQYDEAMLEVYEDDTGPHAEQWIGQALASDHDSNDPTLAQQDERQRHARRPIGRVTSPHDDPRQSFADKVEIGPRVRRDVSRSVRFDLGTSPAHGMPHHH